MSIDQLRRLEHEYQRARRYNIRTRSPAVRPPPELDRSMRLANSRETARLNMTLDRMKKETKQNQKMFDNSIESVKQFQSELRCVSTVPIKTINIKTMLDDIRMREAMRRAEEEEEIDPRFKKFVRRCCTPQIHKNRTGSRPLSGAFVFRKAHD